MKNLLPRILIILFFSSHPLSSEIREHFLVGWIGGKSFLIKSSYLQEKSLGFYQQFYIQLYPTKRFGIQLEMCKQDIEFIDKMKDDEGYLFFDLIYKFPEIKKILIPFLFLGVGFGGTEMESWEGAQKLGVGFKYCIIHEPEGNKIISIPYLNLNFGFLYTRVGGETSERTGVSLYLGIEFGI